MSQPALLSQLALSTRPTEAPTKIDVTNKIRGPIHIRRGRSHPREAFQAGTYSGVLDNTDRRFDPTYQGTLVNLCTNPSFEVDLTGWSSVGTNPPTISRNDREYYSGLYCGRATFAGANSVFGFQLLSHKAAFNGVLVTYSGYVKTTATDVRFGMQANYASATSVMSDLHPGDNQWRRLTAAVTVTFDVGGTTTYIYACLVGQSALTIGYLDAVQVEIGALSAYTDGSLDDCRWAGAAHGSASYRGGPYYGNLVPTRRFWQSAVWNGTTYPMFAGYVDGWPPRFEVGDYRVELPATDGFKVLALMHLNKSYGQQLSHERVNEVLTDVGWTTGNSWVLDSATNSQLGTSTTLGPTSGDRLVKQGQTTIQAQTFVPSDKKDALAHLQEVEKAENGMLFMGREGAVHFYGRHEMHRPLQQAVKAIFGDAAGELPFVDFTPVYDDRELYNVVNCQRKDGAVQTVSDATAKLEHFARSHSETDLLAASDSEMLDRANWLLRRNKAPLWRIQTLVIDPEGDDDLWPVVLGAELGNRYTVRHRPNGGALIEGDYILQGIEWQISEDFRWMAYWTLWPADPTRYWQLTTGSDDYAPYSVLGTSTILGY